MTPRVLLTATGGEVVEVVMYQMGDDGRPIACVITKNPTAMHWVGVDRLVVADPQ